MRQDAVSKRFDDRQIGLRAANAVRDCSLPQQIGGAANAANAAPAQAFPIEAVENAQHVGPLPQPTWEYDQVHALLEMPVPNQYYVPNQPRVDVYPVSSTSRLPHQPSGFAASQLFPSAPVHRDLQQAGVPMPQQAVVPMPQQVQPRVHTVVDAWMTEPANNPYIGQPVASTSRAQFTSLASASQQPSFNGTY